MTIPIAPSPDSLSVARVTRITSMDLLRSLTDRGTTRKQVVGSPSSDILSRVALRLEELKVLDVR